MRDRCGVRHSLLRTCALMSMSYVDSCVSCGKGRGAVIVKSSSTHCFLQ